MTVPDFDEPARDKPGNERVSTAWRALALVYFLVTAVGHLRDPEKWSLISGVILGTHELGHVVFSPFPEWWTVAGGSILQLIAPIIIAIVLARQKEPIGVAIAGCWLAISLANVAVYIGDASHGDLNLVSMGGGDDVTHDWTWLLDHANLIRSDQLIATRVRGAAWVVLALSFVYGFWFSLTGLTSPPTTTTAVNDDGSDENDDDGTTEMIRELRNDIP